MVSKSTEYRRAAAARGEKQDANRARNAARRGIEPPPTATDRYRQQFTKQIESQGTPRLYPRRPENCKHPFVQPTGDYVDGFALTGCVQCKSTVRIPDDLQESA